MCKGQVCGRTAVYLRTLKLAGVEKEKQSWEASDLLAPRPASRRMLLFRTGDVPWRVCFFTSHTNTILCKALESFCSGVRRDLIGSVFCQSFKRHQWVGSTGRKAQRQGSSLMLSETWAKDHSTCCLRTAGDALGSFIGTL